jgi:hypothetical protein
LRICSAYDAGWERRVCRDGYQLTEGIVTPEEGKADQQHRSAQNRSLEIGHSELLPVLCKDIRINWDKQRSWT